jgi:hypothetical protein
MYLPSIARLRNINMGAETGSPASSSHQPAVELETSILRMAVLCLARQFGHRLGEWQYGSDGTVSARCAQCQGIAALHYGGPSTVRVDHALPYACQAG